MAEGDDTRVRGTIKSVQKSSIRSVGFHSLAEGELVEFVIVSVKEDQTKVVDVFRSISGRVFILGFLLALITLYVRDLQRFSAARPCSVHLCLTVCDERVWRMWGEYRQLVEMSTEGEHHSLIDASPIIVSNHRLKMSSQAKNRLGKHHGEPTSVEALDNLYYKKQNGNGMDQVVDLDSGSLTLEISKCGKTYLKRLLAWEKHRSKLQEEIAPGKKTITDL